MNMSEKVEEIDYEPDVLKFKQIWNQMKETNLANPPKKAEVVVKNTKAKDRESNKPKNTEKPKKKQAVISEKNIQRNPKHNPQTVIDVVTNPLGFNVNGFQNQKNRVNKETLLQMPSPESQGTTTDLRNMEKALEQKDYELSLLRVNNTRNEDRIRVLEGEIEKKDKKIWELENQQRSLVSKNSAGLNQERLFDYGKVQYENFKNDSKRLLKMLQNTNEYQTFANLALDDDGVRFLHFVNEKVKGELDSSKKTRLHFCTCNKDFIPESSFWVPEKVYSFGKQFVRERNGELTVSELQLLLYDLNKLWREREKRIINTITSQKCKQIEQLKRRLNSRKSSQKKIRQQ